jgi:hypothetical protein
MSFRQKFKAISPFSPIKPPLVDKQKPPNNEHLRTKYNGSVKPFYMAAG